jgi:CRP-like cAMP-binding protein
MAHDPEIQLALRSSPVFSDLLDEDYELLAEGARMCTFAPEELLVYEDDVSREAYLIVDGEVSIEHTAEREGKYVLLQLAVRRQGDVVGEMALFDSGPRSADARALTMVRAVELRGAEVRRCAEQSPELAQNMIRYLAAKLRQANVKRFGMVNEVRERLLEELREEATRGNGPVEDGWQFLVTSGHRRISQSELAARLACTREVVNRTLAELTKKGLVRTDGPRIWVRPRE